MNLSNKIIKAQNIKLTDSKEKIQPKFIKINFQTEDKSDDKDINKIRDDIIAKRKEIKDACDKAFSEGLRQGINQEKNKLSMAMESVAKLVKDLKISKNEFLKNSEKDVIDLIFLIAKKVVHREVSTSKDIIIHVLRDTIKNINDREGVKIRLNPKDYNYIMELWPDFLDKFCDMENTLIEEDEEIGQGGAVVETHSGEIDARLDHQLDKIKETLISTHLI